MNTLDLVVQQPPTPQHLVLLFHGVGSNASDLVPLGEALAPHLPAAVIVSVQAPDAAGRGWQWFSVQGVTEADRPARVAAAMPGFLQSVRRWQAATAVEPARTTLIGFSQGAIMALESSQLEGPPANRVIALSGRFARPPRVAHASVRTHLMHGDADAVMPVRGTVDALAQLQGLRAVATLDRFPGLGHGIDGRMVDAIVRRLEDTVNDAAADINTMPNDRPLDELESDFAALAGNAAAGGSPATALMTLLHIGDEHLVVLSGSGAAPTTVRRIKLGAARIARDFFHHDPPTSREIELAIDFVEDEIMRLGKPAELDTALWGNGLTLWDWVAVSGQTMPVEIVEQWFQRLASASLGQTGALQGLPAGREAAATLLILREFMHHLGYPAITVVDAVRAQD